MSKDKSYIVYDGRAEYDEDEACIMEAIGEMPRNQAIKRFKKSWGDTDSCLFEYDVKGDTIINGKRVYINE